MAKKFITPSWNQHRCLSYGFLTRCFMLCWYPGGFKSVTSSATKEFLLPFLTVISSVTGHRVDQYWVFQQRHYLRPHWECKSNSSESTQTNSVLIYIQDWHWNRKSPSIEARLSQPWHMALNWVWHFICVNLYYSFLWTCFAEPKRHLGHVGWGVPEARDGHRWDLPGQTEHGLCRTPALWESPQQEFKVSHWPQPAAQLLPHPALRRQGAENEIETE